MCLLVLFTSCDEEDNCGKKFEKLESIEFDNFDPYQCLIHHSYEKIFINDSLTYHSIYGDCSYAPEIDFSQYSIIGYPTSGQCRTTFTRKVVKESDKYIYYILVQSSGNCKSEAESDNLILIPKIENVSNFDVEIIKCRN